MKTDSLYTFITALLVSLALVFSVFTLPALAQETDEETDHSEETTDDSSDDSEGDHEDNDEEGEEGDDHDEEGDDHDEDDDHDKDDESVNHGLMTAQSKIENSPANVAAMQALIKVLQQLIDLLSQKVAMDDSHDHSTHDHGDEHSEVLSIDVEVHDGRTHIHVHEPGMDEVKFFLDDLDVSEEEAIIDAIAEETGLSETDVEEAATFPNGDDEHEHDEDEDDEEDGHDEEGVDHDEENDEEMDLDGLHIMSDGTVMLGNGDVLDGATVTDDGMVMLENGDVVEPEYDLR